LNCRHQFWPAEHIICMELVPNGELFDFIDQLSSPASEGTSRRFLHDVIAGMAECCRSGLTHRDLKPENLLLNEKGRLVIIDLGHAKVAPLASGGDVPSPPPLLKNTTTHRYGTPQFCAPEVVAGKRYDCEASDVWSVAMIAFVLHAKRFAFGVTAKWSDISGPDNEVFWQKIANSGAYPEFPDNLKQFLNAIWRINPAERPSFGQLELAISGDVETISKFPGLQWLAEPTNSIDTFEAELHLALPNIVLSIERPQRPRSWWGCFSWCGR